MGSCATIPRLSRPKKALYFTLGSISLALGILGMVLPVLPTTPFLLLAVACYCRSSERMYGWMLSNKMFGRYISNYRAGRGVPPKVKVLTLGVLWLAIGYSLYAVSFLPVQIALLAVAVVVSAHVIMLPSLKE
jgi:uncharacterized membrane protein YbaN (DUF454 family)